MASNDFAALVERFEKAVQSVANSDGQYAPARTELADARAALLAYGAGVRNAALEHAANVCDGRADSRSDLGQTLVNNEARKCAMAIRSYITEDTTRPTEARDDDLGAALTDLHDRLAAKSQPLPPEDAKILHDNMWDLMDDGGARC